MRELLIGLLLLSAASAAPFPDNSSLADELEKSSASSDGGAPLFAPDCADPHNDHVKCTVHEGEHTTHR